jgi:arylformamidase
MESTANPWIDISVTVESGMVHWPGEAAVEVKRVECINKENEYNVTAISMSAHTGTHVDAPLHILPDGYDVTRMPLDSMIGPVRIFSIRDEEQISLHEIKDFPIEEHGRVFFKTRNSSNDWAKKDFQQDYVFLASDAATFLQSMNVRCIGIDYLSIGGKVNNAKVHHILLGSGISIIEGLNLNGIEDGDYDMICLPIKLKDADGAPARVVIRKRLTTQ